MKPDETVAGVAMDAKMRQIWAALTGVQARAALRPLLPPTPRRIMGCDFIVHPRDNHTEFHMWEHRDLPERMAMDHIAARLADGGQNGGWIVDVGANIGAVCLPLRAALGARWPVLAVEPNPVLRARLRRNIAINGLRGLRVQGCAIGSAEAAEAAIHIPANGNLGQGRVAHPYGHKRETVAAQVPVRTLAQCLARVRAQRIALLKVDVEGQEDQVVCPLLADPAAPRPTLIYFEAAHRRHWRLPLAAALPDAGYAHVGSFGVNQLWERTSPG